MRVRSAALVVLLASSTALSAGAGERPDWMVLQIQVGPEGTRDLRATVTGRASTVEDEPALVGFGYSYGFDRLVDVVPAGAGTIRVSTTDRAGSLEVAIAPIVRSRDLDVSATLQVDGPIAPHTSLGILVFVTGLSFDESTITVSDSAVAVTTMTGAGSSALTAARATDEGLGVAAGPAAIALSSTQTRDIPAGIVGAFVSSAFCIQCSATWTSPTGGGAYTGGEVFRSPDAQAVFSGEPGTWRWTWRGAGVNRGSGVPVAPTFAAYAAVGDIWPLFRPLSF